MHVAYIGNFDPEHSTENHVARAWRNNGHALTEYQENSTDIFKLLAADLRDPGCTYDMVLWTRTGWVPPISRADQMAMLQAAVDVGIPTVGYHLDRWWGLRREHEVADPFFRVSLLVTADGGHEAEWLSAGANHRWFPPGVSRDECLRVPTVRPEYQHDVVFCGSWDSYHPEWAYRLELVEWLKRTYGDRLALYPRPGEHALRGQPLVDLYASAKVMVGDSCLAGGVTNYWSDRIPETLGRGGFLVHPRVQGLEDHFREDFHFVGYELGNFNELKEVIDHYVENDDERKVIAQAGKEHVIRHHTYEVRVEELVGAVRGLLV